MDSLELRKLLSALLLPPTGFLMVAMVGFVLAAWPVRAEDPQRLWRDRRAGRRSGQSWRRRFGLLLVLFGLASAILVSTWPVARHVPNWLEAPYVSLDPAGTRMPTTRLEAWRAAPATAPQAIVMLTAGASTDGPGSDRDERLSGDTTERAIHAARLARLTGLPILVSGGTVRPIRGSLAALSREFIEGDLGVPVRWAEEQSRDTAGNARFTAAMLHPEGITRILLVTGATHMRRSQRLFENRGFTVIPAPCCFIGKSSANAWQWFWPTGEALMASYVSGHEIVGMFWYGLTGWPGSTDKR